MINVVIGATERPVEQADQSWINEQINRRRNGGDSVCVRVRIEQNDLNMVLSTPNCGGGSGGGRAPTERERRIFDLWEQRGLNRPHFTGGEVIAFLRQLDRLV
jgi:hypothetical protein